jgi:hypothetical protein
LRRITRFLLPTLLFCLYAGQCTWFIKTQSFTLDEPSHIAAGLEAWRYGKFEHQNDHPPLARLLFSLPIAGSGWNLERLDEDSPISAVAPDPETLAWWARAVNVVLGLLLMLALWLTARRFFSEGAANVVLALFAFSPPLIAHFSLATTDGVATLATFVVAVQLIRWRHNPSRFQTALLGLALGAVLIAKYSTPPMFTLAVFLVLVLKPDTVAWRPKSWNWGNAATVVVITALVIWGGYFFHITKITIGNGKVTVYYPNYEKPSVTAMRTPVAMSLYVPAAEFVRGLGAVLRHNRRGHPSFFLGEMSPIGGWRLYFPVAVGLKWPTVVLLLFVATLVLVLSRRLVLPRDLAWLMLFPAVFFLLAIFSRINIGDRHILPVYPFVLLVTAGIGEFTRRRLSVRALVVALLLLNAADSTRYAPDYLSHFNVFVKPTESWKLLIDSNLDWGQGLLALREYESKHPEERIYLAYYGNVVPSVYGIRAQPLGGSKPATGTVIVSASLLAGHRLGDPAMYRWVLNYPRKALLNHTLHVFEMPRHSP